MSVVVSTVTGIRPVVNRILPYFDGRLRPSYGSKYETIFYKLFVYKPVVAARNVCLINDEVAWKWLRLRANDFWGRSRGSVYTRHVSVRSVSGYTVIDSFF